MLTSFFGIKIDQTQAYDEKGNRIPVTLIAVEPATVVQHKTKEIDGYEAAQISIGQKKHSSQAVLGHVKKVKMEKAPHYLREVTPLSGFNKKEGEIISVDEVFKEGDLVKVAGTSKGKGFAGVVKRHHFHGGPKTHGQSDRERAPGSIGSTTTPGRVYKGKRMAGRLGGEFASVKNLKIFKIDKEKNQILIYGLVPGPKKGLVEITKLV